MGRIVHSCGHAQDHYIIGTYAADCDRRAAKLARQACDQRRRAAAERITAEQHSALADLAPVALQGSPRQAVWAETIRAKHLSVLLESDREAANVLTRIADAGWWIERRTSKVSIVIGDAIG